MNKINKDNLLRVLLLIIFLLIPFLLAYCGQIFNIEFIGRLIGLAILLIGLPILLLWLAIKSKYKDSFGATINGKRYTKPGRIICILLSIFMLTLSYNFILDFFDLMKNGVIEVEGKVNETRRTPYMLLIKGQNIYLDNVQEPLASIFSPYLVKKNDYVKVKYLPRSQFIIEIKK